MAKWVGTIAAFALCGRWWQDDREGTCSMLSVTDIIAKKVNTLEFEASAEEATGPAWPTDRGGPGNTTEPAGWSGYWP